MYCTQSDLEAAWSVAAVLDSVDDDASGTLSPQELEYIDRAIERGANRMNASLEMRYSLDDLVVSDWCRDCCAALAIYLLATRRGDDAPDWIAEQYAAYLADLAEIRAGRMKVPGIPETFDTTPSVSNFRVRLGGSPEAIDGETD